MTKINEIMANFTYDELPPEQQVSVLPICQLACDINNSIPDHPEKTKCLEKLAAVRENIIAAMNHLAAAKG